MLAPELSPCPRPHYMPHLGSIQEVAHGQEGGKDTLEGLVFGQLLHPKFQIKKRLCNFLHSNTEDKL